MSTHAKQGKGRMFFTVVMAIAILGMLAYVLLFTELIIKADVEDAETSTEQVE